MTNIDRWPEAFQDGIPKVGGKWRGSGPSVFALSADERLWQWGRTTLQTNPYMTFLGFSDSAPVNQGAAAPQAASVVGDGFEMVSNFGCTLGCGKQAITGCRSCYAGRCADHASPHLPQCKHFKRVAPIAAPPPSLKAAVQQEGLSIPPQAGTRHEIFERCMRADEASGRFDSAEHHAISARASLAADLAYDAEADAIREGRTVLKATLKEMGQGDRRCFELRGLREFEAIKSAEHALYFWWAR